MTTASHQTVRLSPGRHRGPEKGACVMELASMLAGERFSDRPRGVCPVLSVVLRSYNDALDDVRRQDLLRYAADSVGTSGDHAASARRAQACVTWFGADVPPARRTRFRAIDRWLGRTSRGRLSYAVRTYARGTTDESHAGALRFIDRLISVGRAEQDHLSERCLLVAGRHQHTST